MIGVIYTDNIYESGVDILLKVADASKLEKSRGLGSRFIAKYSDGWQWIISTTPVTFFVDKCVIDKKASLPKRIVSKVKEKAKEIIEI